MTCLTPLASLLRINHFCTHLWRAELLAEAQSKHKLWFRGGGSPWLLQDQEGIGTILPPLAVLGLSNAQSPSTPLPSKVVDANLSSPVVSLALDLVTTWQATSGQDHQCLAAMR